MGKVATPFEATEGYGPVNIVETIEPGHRVKTDEELRNVILRTIRNPTHGGNYLDYINWVESVPGIRKAWCQTAELYGTPGKIKVTFLESEFTTEQISKVKELLDRLAPASAQVEVVKPSIREVTVLYKINPNSEHLKKDVDKAIMEFFLRESQPGMYRDQNGDVTPREIPLSRLNAVMSNVPGVQSHELLSPTRSELQIAKDELLVPEFK